MNKSNLHLEIKQLIINTLGLEDISPDDIDAEQPLFGEEVGLDSVDALELGLAVQKHFHIKIDSETKDTRQHFASVAALAAFISSQRDANQTL